MPRKSKIDQLPDEVRDRINRMMADGLALDDIVDWLDELELDDEAKPSRSGLGRHAVKQTELSRQLRHSRDVAKALAAELGHEDASQQSRVAIEVLQTTIMKLSAAAMTGAIPDLSPQEILGLSKSTKELAAAVDIDDKRRARIREDALKDAAKAVESAALSQGLTKETARDMRSAVLGVDVA